MRVLLLLALLTVAQFSRAAEYHVAKTGSGSDCTLVSPCLTIALGLAVAGVGDTLWVHAGTYVEQISTDLYTIAGGTSEASRLRIEEWPGDAVILRPTTGVDVVHLAAAMASYIDIVGFDIDAVSVIGGVKITYTGPATNASHHIRIIRCEIRNGKIAAGSGILVTGPYSTFNEFIENYIHHHGGHGLYISTADNLIRSNEVSYVDQIGIAVYLGGSGTGVDRNRVLFNRTHHNSQAASSDAGILISSGKDNEVRGNRSSYNSYGIRLYGGDPPDHLNPAVDTILADNYNWSNSVSAILVDAEATGTVQTNNSTTEPAAAYPASNDPFAGIHGEPAAVPVRHQVCDSAQKSP